MPFTNCAEMTAGDEVTVFADEWEARIEHLPNERDLAGRQRYRLRIINPAGEALYDSDDLFLHGFHNPYIEAAGWAAAIADAGSGYATDIEDRQSNPTLYDAIQHVRATVPAGVADEWGIQSSED